MGDKKNGTDNKRHDDLLKASGAASSPSEETRPARHTFVLRLIPDIRGPGKPPRWRGELEHSSCGKTSKPQRFTSITAMLAAVKERVWRITSDKKPET
jgi:hypothetical protein